MIELDEMGVEKLQDLGIEKCNDEEPCFFCEKPAKYASKYPYIRICSVKCYERLLRVNGANPTHMPQWTKWNERTDYLSLSNMDIFVENLSRESKNWKLPFKVTYKIRLPYIMEGVTPQNIFKSKHKEEIVVQNFVDADDFYEVEDKIMDALLSWSEEINKELNRLKSNSN